MFRLTNGWLTLFGFYYSSLRIVTWPLGFSQSIFRITRKKINKALCWWHVALFPFGFVPCFLLPWRHVVVKNNCETIFLTFFLTYNFHVLFFTFYFSRFIFHVLFFTFIFYFLFFTIYRKASKMNFKLSKEMVKHYERKRHSFGDQIYIL